MIESPKSIIIDTSALEHDLSQVKEARRAQNAVHFQVPIYALKQGSGGLFSTSNPQDSSALTAPIFGTKGSSTGTYQVCRLDKPILRVCCHICKNEVSLDMTQDREPVERPFHNLPTNGLSLNRDPQTPEIGTVFGKEGS